MNDKKEVMIAMDPDMAAKFEASTHVSRKYCRIISTFDICISYL